MITDLVIALFVAILVVTGLYVSRIGDAVGRRVRGDHRRDPPSRP